MSKKPEFAVKIWDGDPDVLMRYANLLSQVYSRPFSSTHIQWKHANNPLGPSLITYAETPEGEMVAARAFWRMYSEDSPIYQPCDTVTRSDFQRRGLFSQLTKLCLDKLESNAVVVNFPNHNSYPAYLKLGWQLYADNKKVMGFSVFKGKAISDLNAYLSDKVADSRRDFLCWRFNSISETDYRFYQHKLGVVVDNGQTTGLISFAQTPVPFAKKSGLTKGYVLPQYFATFKHALLGTLALPCSSRTAYYLMPESSITSLESAFSLAQVNTLMDTF